MLTTLLPILTEDPAVVNARRFMHEVGYREHLTSPMVKTEPSGERRITFRRGQEEVSIVVDAANEVATMFTVDRRRHPKPLSPEAAYARAHFLARKFAPGVGLGFPNFFVGEKGQVVVTLIAKSGGRRFFNEIPTFGMNFGFHGNRLSWFRRNVKLPPVNATQPRISANEAMVRLRTAGKQQTGRISTMLLTDAVASNKYHLVPELGYFQFKEETQARLVWRGVLFSEWGFYRIEPIPLFVDALTGEFLSPGRAPRPAV